MKRTLVAILVLGLLGGSLATVAEAKKKKPKKLVPAEQKYFLHWKGDGATPPGCTDIVYMDLQDTAGDAGCSDSTQVAQEVFDQTGQELVSTTYPATEGVPLTLDASRHLTGTIVLTGTVTANASAQLELSGTVGGADTVVATGETTTGNGALSNNPSGLIQLPGPGAVLPVDIALDTAFDKKLVTALTLKVTIRGVHRGGVDYERQPSHIIVPTFTK
jgi:hypothetical protein